MTIGMTCPACGKGGALTIDSRGGPNTVRRRRECVHCKHRWTTYEMPAAVVDRIARRERAIEAIQAYLQALKDGG